MNVRDQINRPITEGATVVVDAPGERATVVGPTQGRRTMVDVRLGSGRVLAFYGSGLFLV